MERTMSAVMPSARARAMMPPVTDKTTARRASRIEASRRESACRSTRSTIFSISSLTLRMRD